MTFNVKGLNQKGQALLIVVLVMVVALTVTLSLVSRSVVNLKTSVQQTSSQKALSAAEAGVEQAIKNNVNIGTSSPQNLGQAQYSATVTQLSDNNQGFVVNGANIVPKDEGAYIWLAQDPGGTLTPSWPSDDPTKNANLYLYWGDNSGDLKNAALEVVLIYGADKNTSLIKRFAFDPSGSRASSNKFDTVDNVTFSKGSYNVGGRAFTYQARLNISQGILLRVNPIYYSTFVGVKRVNSTDPALPTQGKIITSSGCSPNCTDSNSVQRKITVFQGYPQLPAELFPYSILSP